MAGTHQSSVSRVTCSIPGNDSTTSTAGFCGSCRWGARPRKSPSRRVDGPARQNSHHRTNRPTQLGPNIGPPEHRGALHGRNVHPFTRPRFRGCLGLWWLPGRTHPHPSPWLSHSASPSLAGIGSDDGASPTPIATGSLTNVPNTDAHEQRRNRLALWPAAQSWGKPGGKSG